MLRRRTRGSRDHPRLRGEQGSNVGCGTRNGGSPPLARGTGRVADAAWRPCRITPACAGNRRLWMDSSICLWDHPRLRGEQSSNFDILAAKSGSPPLARGTERYALYKSWRLGITPACAGNRCPPPARVMLVRDHPRLRGEQLSSAFSFLVIVGSPPLARGTGPNGNDGRICRRITPACAGNRMGRFECGANSRDYPRLRGEQCIVYRPYFFNLGSPPLARGTGVAIACMAARVRITPACAGNSFCDFDRP